MPTGIYKRIKPPWNKGLFICTNTGKTHFEKEHTTWNKGIKTGLVPKTAFKKGHIPWFKKKGMKNPTNGISYNKGKKFPQWSERQLGEKNHNWKGGITPIRTKIWFSLQYQNWRLSIFERDKFTCQKCGKKGCELNAHHLKLFIKYPKLRFNINNGITLCKSCHKLAHKVAI